MTILLTLPSAVQTEMVVWMLLKGHNDSWGTTIANGKSEKRLPVTVMLPPGLACFWEGGLADHCYRVLGSSTRLSTSFTGFPVERQPSDRPVAYSTAELHAIKLLSHRVYNLLSLPFCRIEMHASVHFEHFNFYFLAVHLFHQKTVYSLTGSKKKVINWIFIKKMENTSNSSRTQLTTTIIFSSICIRFVRNVQL